MQTPNADVPTPRKNRLRLNLMEAWFRKNADRYTPADQVFIRYGFDIAKEPSDADTLTQMLRDGLDHAPATSTSAIHA